MTCCPTSDTLRRLLEGELTAEQHAVAASHVDHCTVCQQFLDTVTDGTPLRQWLAGNVPDAWSSALWGQDVIAGASYDSSQPALAMPANFGAYLVVEEVGQGGMGHVFRAIDPLLGRTVAIKTMSRLQHNAAERQRFMLEARALANLRSDHIVEVYSVHDQPDASPYFVMEWVDGVSLKQLVEADGPLAPRRAASYVAQAARGLATAHTLGMVHRDVKPSNLLFDKAQNRVKVGDFGLVRFDDQVEELTRSGMLLGTPGAMSPEQIDRPQQVDARTDIYGLGICLYYALTGEMPFRGTMHAVLAAVRNADPTPPRKLNPDIPIDLETIALRCLHKSPDRRFSSAAELAEELERFLKNQPILSRRISSVERASRFIARNPLISSLASLLAIALVAGTVASTWFGWRAGQQRSLAEQNRREAERRLEAALRTIDEVCVRISEDRLLEEPGLQPLRRQLLELATRQLQEFVDQQPEDARLLIPWCEAAARLAEVQRQTVGPQASKATLAPALAALSTFRTSQIDRTDQIDRIDRTDPTEPFDDPNRVRQLYAKLLMNLAIAEENLGEYSEADARWQQVEMLCRDSMDPMDRWLLAKAYLNWGKSAGDQGDWQRSYDLTLRAQQLARELVNEDQLLPESRHTYAYSTGNLVSPLAAMGQMPQAEAACRESIAIWTQCRQASPGDLTPPLEVFRNATNLADIFIAGRRWDELLALCSQTRPDCDHFYQQNPNLQGARLFRARLAYVDALAKHQTGSLDSARADYLECLEQYTFETELNPANEFPKQMQLMITLSIAGSELDALRTNEALSWLSKYDQLLTELPNQSGAIASIKEVLVQLRCLAETLVHYEAGEVSSAISALDRAMVARPTDNQALCEALRHLIRHLTRISDTFWEDPTHVSEDSRESTLAESNDRFHQELPIDAAIPPTLLADANRQFDALNQSFQMPGAMLCLGASIKMQLFQQDATTGGNDGDQPPVDRTGSGDRQPDSADQGERNSVAAGAEADRLRAEAQELLRRAHRLGHFAKPARRHRARSLPGLELLISQFAGPE